MELNAEAARMASTLGKENVYNYSLGNPSLRPPQSVYDAISAILKEEDQIAVHGYSANAGMPKVRKAVADHINTRFGRNLSQEDIFIVPGSSAGLSMLCKGLSEDEDEFIVIAPFFPEYRAYLAATTAKLVVVDADPVSFYPDCRKIREAITKKTKALIVNTRNNPTGVIYPYEVLKELTDLLKEKEAEYGHPIFLISDEPYREIVYESEDLPYLMDMYDDTIVSYSYSKSLSLAGERIGYLAFSEHLSHKAEIIRAVAGAGRIFGHCCAPTLFQLVIMQCINDLSGVAQYKDNRDLLLKQLDRYGFTYIYPSGAFYILLKSPIAESVPVARHA
ncbi:MAG: pyridoxal phosphate-dependent aminotransferase, partial [Oscillospiraceae bacterium]|nr:pyridoxal phosphate-dependent aminotransferase [Oscillospiraceae bacterium]